MSKQTNHGNFLDTPQLQKGVTRFWLIRHALVEQNARMRLYGTMDVALCPDSLKTQRWMYAALARRLPHPALWFTSPLSRTQHTARAIQEAGYGQHELHVEPDLIEQSLGEWHGIEHHTLPERLNLPAHPFWSVSATEQPPQGESMVQVCARVGACLDRLAARHAGQDMVVVSHGGAIRGALAHALRIHADTALHFSIQNLSLSIIERLPEGWRIVTVNELPQPAMGRTGPRAITHAAVIDPDQTEDETYTDALYARAVAIVARENKASASFLQRLLPVSYSCAARMIGQMEREGRVSGPNHIGRREVLMSRTGD
ncbi:cell division protein FtsK [Komagataeibacter rhaeticus]|uniref:Cell division protein FtsK n=2 Tax=Komagataeibacter rhaeticus TaxID=215221 RepID=A0A181C6H8_9PROT|nr:cell division protein FtsK [Komagataeibacter xylinus]EGG77776.1 DNA translocase ftsK [Gluconacetobacter sp. SXCC-1]KDU96213.1 cell division protein FtsK [Komagataeibacter rhaeticus AF1]MBL7239071.1 histidine phosphatase family protein [Komagataeibacter rhaeticus]PYD54971.1 cell division protein FtsK [Komagataeibacter rhaeticus]